MTRVGYLYHPFFLCLYFLKLLPFYHKNLKSPLFKGNLCVVVEWWQYGSKWQILAKKFGNAAIF